MGHLVRDIPQRRDGQLREDKKLTRNEALAIAAGAVGAKTVERITTDLANRKTRFNNFDEVLKHYSGTKPGDVLLFQDTFTGGKSHPIVILDGEHHYYWPTKEGFDGGIKKPLKVPITPDIDAQIAKAKGSWEYARNHIKQILGPDASEDLVNRYDFKPYKGKFFEMGPGGSALVNGSLEGKLYEMSSTQKKIPDPDHKFAWKRTFSPESATRLSSVYRSSQVDPEKLENIVDLLTAKNEKGGVRYSALALKFDPNADCTRGTCITAADGVLRGAGVNRPKTSFFPSQLVKNLEEVIPPKQRSIGRLTMIAPIVAGVGLKEILDGQKENDSRKTLVGAATVGAAVGMNVVDPIKNKLNTLGGLFARSLGAATIEMSAQLADKIKDKVTKSYTPQWKTNRYAAQQWLGRHPRVGGRIGAGLLTLPAVYGVHKLMRAFDKREK